jgi:hypothetical protein
MLMRLPAASPRPVLFAAGHNLMPTTGTLPWRSGFGQCAPDLARLQTYRAQPLGCFSAWVNLSRCRTWTDLRGGPPGRLDETADLFGDLGAYHLMRVLRTQPKSLPVSWMYPLLPQAESNRRVAGRWSNQAVWWRLAKQERAFVQEVWAEVGYRVASLLLTHGKPFGLFTLVPGWEGPGGSWYAWSCGPDYRHFIEHWKIAHDAFYKGAMKRHIDAAGIRIEFRYAGSNSSGAPSLRALYPGNAHVGLIGRSLHEDPAHPWATDKGWLHEARGNGWGLSDVRDLCLARTRKLAIEEWSIHRLDDGPWKASPDAAGAMARVHAWFAANAEHLECEAFLHSRVTSLLEQPTWPGAVAYRELWGKQSVTAAA